MDENEDGWSYDNRTNTSNHIAYDVWQRLHLGSSPRQSKPIIQGGGRIALFPGWSIGKISDIDRESPHICHYREPFRSASLELAEQGTLECVLPEQHFAVRLDTFIGNSLGACGYPKMRTKYTHLACSLDGHHVEQACVGHKRIPAGLDGHS